MQQRILIKGKKKKATGIHQYTEYTIQATKTILTQHLNKQYHEFFNMLHKTLFDG